MLKRFSEKLRAQSKISCQYTWLLHGNSVVIFQLQASPVEGQSLQEKEKKGEKGKVKKKLKSRKA